MMGNGYKILKNEIAQKRIGEALKQKQQNLF